MTTPTPRIPGRRLLHSPGPTPVPEAVLHAMSMQPMDLGDPRVDAVIASCERGLKRLLQTARTDYTILGNVADDVEIRMA